MGRSILVCSGSGAERHATHSRLASLRRMIGSIIQIATALGMLGTAVAATLSTKDTLPPKTKPGVPAVPSRSPVSTPAMTIPAAGITGAPNLLVEGVSWRPPMIKDGSPIHFDFRVRNAGGAAAPTSNVVIYRADAPIVTQVLPPLAPGAAQHGSAVIEARCGASVTIRADAPNQVSESNETDNIWTMKLNCLQTGAGFAASKMTAPATVTAARAARNPAGGTGNSANPPAPAQPTGCSPDLYVRRVEIDPPYPRAWENYRIKIWAIQFYPDNMPEIPSSFLAVRKPGHTTVIDSRYERIPSSSTTDPDYQWLRTDNGPQNLEVYIRLDHQNKLPECNEGNNEYVHPFTVYAANEPMADLQFRGNVSFPMHNLVNRDIELSGQIVNQGTAESRPFWLEFDCDDNRDAGTRLVHRMRVTSLIPPGGGVAAFNTRIRWNNPGYKVCKTRLDKDDEVIETKEHNNEYIGVSIRVDNPPPVQ